MCKVWTLFAYRFMSGLCLLIVFSFNVLCPEFVCLAFLVLTLMSGPYLIIVFSLDVLCQIFVCLSFLVLTFYVPV